MTKQILAFLFCFTRELNPYTPLTLSLTLRARTQTLYLPLTLTLRPPIRPYLPNSNLNTTPNQRRREKPSAQS